MIQAVIFDMDGTMVDSEILHYQAYRDALKEFGIDFKIKEYTPYFGVQDRKACIDLIENFTLPILAEKLLENKNAIFNKNYIDKVVPQKGLFELLEKLKNDNYPLAVASSSQMKEIERILEKLDIRNYFKAILSAESVTHGKPAPDIFLLAAEKLNAKPKNCLVLEDSLRGVQAAKNAGMTCYAIPTMWSKNEDFGMANKILNDLEEVIDFLL